MTYDFFMVVLGVAFVAALVAGLYAVARAKSGPPPVRTAADGSPANEAGRLQRDSGNERLNRNLGTNAALWIAFLMVAILVAYFAIRSAA